ncbi:zinc finger protein 808-like [Armigeres subalbatus]|uniref:zinc finger protein 808-like n=1 Tax=Armigeres subalbatus TaxID=124917 RepID=UPI002ED5E4C6
MTSLEIKKELDSFDRQICRLCLSEDSLESIFKENDLHQWISDYLSIAVSIDDRLSQTICSVCRLRLTVFHQYRIQCHEVQNKLLSKLKDEDEKAATSKADHSKTDTGTASQASRVRKGQKGVPPFQCDVCHKVFLVGRQLTDHRRTHRPKHVCKFCGASYVRRDQYERHLEKTHANEVLQDQNEAKTDDKGQTEGEQREIKTEPPEEQSSVVGAREQIDELEPMNQSQYSKVDESTVQEDAELKSNAIEFQDDESSLGHSDEEEYQTNVIEDIIVVEEVKIETTQEEDESTSQVALTTYMTVGDVDANEKELQKLAKAAKKERVYTGDPLQCKICFKQCRSKQALWCHNKSVHGPKNHGCVLCGFKFASPSDLHAHFQCKQHLRKKKEARENGVNVVEITKKGTEEDKSNKKPDEGINETVDDTVQSSNKALGASDPSKLNDTQDSIIAEADTSVEQKTETTKSVDRYPCTKCNRSFTRQCQLKNHLRNHDEKARNDGESSLSDDDDTDYSESASGVNHSEQGKEGSDDEEQLQCDLCDKVLESKKRLQDHKRNKHRPKNNPCLICGKPFIMKSSMEHHMRIHRPKVKRKRTKPSDEEHRPFKCDVCEKAFKIRRNLIYHKKYIHGPKNLECHICGFRFSMRFALDMHVQRHIRYRDSREDYLPFLQKQQKTESITVDDDDSKSELKESTESSIKLLGTESEPNSSTIECGQCDRVFQDQRSRLLHYKYAHKKKLKCSVCNVMFSSHKRMVIHMIKRHKKEDGSYQPMKCEICNKVFPTTSQWTEHKIIHGPRRYSCKLCPKTFTKSQHLKSHLNFHVDVGDDFMKPARVRKGYECEICHKVIQLRKHMQGHIRKVHGSILHECTTCKRLFKERQELEIHMETHNAPHQEDGKLSESSKGNVDSLNQVEKTDNQSVNTSEANSETATSKSKERQDQASEQIGEFECGECHKEFKNTKYLYNHIRNVHEPKQHLCSSCGKAFLSRQYLIRHQSTHKNDHQPLSCTKCNKTFPSWRKTYMHMRLHAPRIHKCNVDDCTKAYTTNGQLLVHMKSHNSKKLSEEKPVDQSNEDENSQKKKRKSVKRKTYSCTICVKKFRSKVKLDAHNEEKHQSNRKQAEQQPESNAPREKDVNRASLPDGSVILFEPEEFKIEPE